MRLPVLLIGLALLGLLVVLRLADPAPLAAMRLAYFDTLQRLSPREAKSVPVRIVDIDEASLAQYGQWPWPRDRLADLTRKIAAAGAAAIAFDVIFAEPDRMSPTRLVDSPALAGLLRDGISPDRLSALDTDRAFAAAIDTIPTVLAIARSGQREGHSVRALAELTEIGETPRAALPALGPATALVPILAEAAQGIGAISIGPGANGAVARTLPLAWETPEGVMPSLALEALRVALGEDGVVLWEAEDAPGTIERISVGTYEIPTTPRGELWLKARYEDPTTHIPAARVLSEGPLSELRGSIVFVGTSAAGLLDLRTTALGETVPGVAVHAQAVEQILTGQNLVRSDFAGGLELLLLVSAGLLVAASMSLSGPSTSVLVGSGAAFAILAASWAGFADDGLLIDATMPLFGTALMFSLLTLYRLFVTDRDARLIRRSFSHYVAPDVLREIETGGHRIALGGSDQPVTVMFSDIRNFTHLSETLGAQEVVALLNRLFDGLSYEIMRHQGTIDKFMGDSVMAFWNAPVPAPDHAVRACRAALAMREALAHINAASDRPEIRMGIGLATGMACVGNIGSRERFNYTAVGATVNAAARLEAACRAVEYDIVAGQSVRDAAPELAWLPAGLLTAKGVSEPIAAFILVGDETVAAEPDFANLARDHAAYVSALATGQVSTELAAHLLDAASRFPGLAEFHARLAGRAGDFATTSEQAAPERTA